MKSQAIRVLVAVWALLGACAWFLGTLQARQKLGEPGVRVVAEPTYGFEVTPAGRTNLFLAVSNSVYLPPKVLDYESVSNPIARKVLDWLPKDTTYGQRSYTAQDGFSIDTMVVLMGTDRTSIHQPRYCLPGSGWRIESEQPVFIPVGQPPGQPAYELPVMKVKVSGRFTARNGTEVPLEALFLYWFVAENQLTADHLQRMWWMGRDLVLKGTLQRWAYVTCFALAQPGQEDAVFKRLSQFIQAAAPEFQRVSGQPRQAGAQARSGGV